MRTLAERIVWARARAGWTQQELANKAGVAQGTIGNLESGARDSSKKITSIAKALNVDAHWLAEGEGAPQKSENNAHPAISGAKRVVLTDDNPNDFYQIQKVTLRLQAGVTGFQAVPDKHDGGTMGLPRSWVERKGYSPENLIAIQVRGESMEPTFYEDDTVIINTADTKPVDNSVFAINYDGEAVIKRMSRDAGQWWLMSDNFDQRKFYRRLCQSAECIIIGRVVRREGDHF